MAVKKEVLGELCSHHLPLRDIELLEEEARRSMDPGVENCLQVGEYGSGHEGIYLVLPEVLDDGHRNRPEAMRQHGYSEVFIAIVVEHVEAGCRALDIHPDLDSDDERPTFDW